MNCFPCKGPACNACGKFERTHAFVSKHNNIRCPFCQGRVDLQKGTCMKCNKRVIAPPGSTSTLVE